jgi:hypothetical protein
MSSNEVNANFQRDQIAQVFKTPDMIRAFEALVRQATEITPAQGGELTEELYSVALSGNQQASQTRNAFNEIDQMQSRRYVDLTAIQNQINDIKTFIGMT